MIDKLHPITLIFLAVWYGWFEAALVDSGWNSGEKIIFGKFSWYHVRLLIGTLIVAIGNWHLIPLLVLIQDISFFTFSEKALNETSWINLWWGGLSILGKWIPLTYIILLILYIILEIIF